MKNTIAQLLIPTLLLISPHHLYASDQADFKDWSITHELGQTNIHFRGSTDKVVVYGLKFEKLWSSNFSTFISLHESGESTLNNVSRFGTNVGQSIPGVTVTGDYSDISLGFTRRFELNNTFFTATLGYSQLSMSASADIPNVATIYVKDDDTNIFYGIGWEYPISENWIIDADLRYNELFSDSSIARLTFGIEYRF